MNRRDLLVLPLGLAALGACASVAVMQTTTLLGVIETLDPTSRELLLRGAAGDQSGALLSMVVGRAVRRFDRLRPGDRVTVVFYQAIAAQALRPLSGATPPFAGMSIAREADRPGGEITRVRSGRVTITAVDIETATVSFTGPGDLSRTVVAQNPQLQGFIRSLRVGEQVDMIYEEALAISITPAG